MPRACIMVGLGVAFPLLLLFGASGNGASLPLWQKALFFVAGAAAAFVLPRVFASGESSDMPLEPVGVKVVRAGRRGPLQG